MFESTSRAPHLAHRLRYPGQWCRAPPGSTRDWPSLTGRVAVITIGVENTEKSRFDTKL